MRAVWCLLLAGQFLSAQTTADTLFERGQKAQVAGRAAEAEAAYREYLRRFGPTAEVLANLGALLAQRENYSEAIRYYEQALRIHPSLAPLHLNLGLAYLKQGQMAAAVRDLDLFLKAQPGHRQAMQLRAVALFEMERYAEAEAQYRAFEPSADVSVALGLSAALLRQQKVAEARAVLEPVLASEDSAELQLTLGQVMLQEDRMDEAMAAFEKARSLNSNLPQLRLHIGALYWRQRKTAEAVAEWRAEHKAYPRSFEAVYTLGAALALNPEAREEAEKLLRKAAAMRPRNAHANYQLAKLVWQKSKGEEAAVFLERATQADAEFREAFYLKGTVLQALGRKAEAAQAFARVKELSEKSLARQRDLFSESQ
ncbi:MAG: tetratricopeptide repeat protein [Acidobacteria bacterium]|nr:tetratricopeptide repeat protein [Acidobacteriota bacterium]